jgi:hypothetical protein
VRPLAFAPAPTDLPRPAAQARCTRLHHSHLILATFADYRQV